MKIAGLEPLTLQDYPGELAAVIFTAGCNLRCPYCHNPELVAQEEDDAKLFSSKEILAFLEKRSPYLDAVVISGGEPLINKGLISYLKKIKDLGYKIRIDTNGTRPEVLDELLSEKLLDMVGWDYKLPLNRYPEFLPGHKSSAGATRAKGKKIIAALKQTGEILSNSEIEVEIRTTAVPELITSSDIAKISQEIAEFTSSDNNQCKRERVFPSSYVIQGFRNERVLSQSFSSVSPYSLNQLQEFKAIATKYINSDTVKIRKNL